MENEDIFNEIVKPKAMKKLERAQLPEDKVRAKAWEDTYLKELSSKRYGYDSRGKVILLDEAGQELQDEHGHPVLDKEYIDEVFNKYFELSGLPLTQTEFEYMLRDKDITPEQRVKITNYWREKHPEYFKDLGKYMF